ncbi:MAG: hypothetical protein GY841_22475 [FCB group bacterium]|nr:hypothetical protein [FCB group bacterium]
MMNEYERRDLIIREVYGAIVGHCEYLGLCKFRLEVGESISEDVTNALAQHGDFIEVIRGSCAPGLMRLMSIPATPGVHLNGSPITIENTFTQAMLPRECIREDEDER